MCNTLVYEVTHAEVPARSGPTFSPSSNYELHVNGETTHDLMLQHMMVQLQRRNAIPTGNAISDIINAQIIYTGTAVNSVHAVVCCAVLASLCARNELFTNRIFHKWNH